MRHYAAPQAARPRAFSGPFWALYKVLVACSALVVGGYLAWIFFVVPPQVAPPPVPGVTEPAGGVLSPDASSLPASGGTALNQRKEQFYTILLVGCDDGHGNADTIMILGYDVLQGKAGLVSVPRDTLVERNWSGFPKLNAAFGHGGVELLSQELTETLGIPIDYYIKVDLNAFVKLVDELGGLDFHVPQDMYHDDEAGFVINLNKGQQHLTGHQTLQLVRYRGYVSADVGRTQVQQQVLAALAKKALSLGSVTKLGAFAEIFSQYVETDLSLSNLLFFAQSALSLDLQEGLVTHTLAGRGDAQKGSYTWCYELDAEDALNTVNDLLNPYLQPLTLEDMELVRGDKYHFD